MISIPFDPESADYHSITTLLRIMAALRDPAGGCPWDLEQTFETIAPYTIEEAYEVAEAIERKDMAGLVQELGDLLLQVVYHAQIAAEQRTFSFEDVVGAICRKMVRRHPHVFGDDKARSAGAAKSFWETMKAQEKLGQGAASSALEGVPTALPALSRALKLQAKAARVRFDWPSTDEVLDKISEEARELKSAPKAKQHEELGDLLFVVVNFARHLDVDPEAALRSANAKFERRFAYIERALRGKGKTPAQSSLEEMDALWNEAKQGEKG
jgi:tetrapyrrole methylase family protein/MazG family protein/ATP diphosphatase